MFWEQSISSRIKTAAQITSIPAQTGMASVGTLLSQSHSCLPQAEFSWKHLLVLWDHCGINPQLVWDSSHRCLFGKSPNLSSFCTPQSSSSSQLQHPQAQGHWDTGTGPKIHGDGQRTLPMMAVTPWEGGWSSTP